MKCFILLLVIGAVACDTNKLAGKFVWDLLKVTFSARYNVKNTATVMCDVLKLNFSLLCRLLRCTLWLAPVTPASRCTTPFPSPLSPAPPRPSPASTPTWRRNAKCSIVVTRLATSRPTSAWIRPFSTRLRWSAIRGTTLNAAGKFMLMKIWNCWMWFNLISKRPQIWSSFNFALQQIWGCGELRQLSTLHPTAALRHSPGRLHHSVSVGGDEKSGRGATDQLPVVFRKCRRADRQTSQSSSDHQTFLVNPALASWENGMLLARIN